MTSKMESCKIKSISGNGDISRIVREELTDEFCDGYVLVGEEETLMPRYYENFAEDIKNFEVRNSDVMVCTYPKAGTTWTQEMVWLIANNLDYEGAKTVLGKRFPFLEYCTLLDHQKLENFMGVKLPGFISDSLQYTMQQQNPRFIKTHLPFSLLPQDIQNGCKSPKCSLLQMIYVIRNSKDLCVSYYHHGKILHGWKANLENFSKVFMANRIMWGSYWKHVFGYWNRKNDLNLLIISYEDMKKDLPSVIKKVANFLEKKLTEDQIKGLSGHLSFESMKNNNAVNFEGLLSLRREKKLVLEDGRFIRSGVVGKYKEEMSPEMIRQFDAWIAENVAGTSFGEQYKYIL